MNIKTEIQRLGVLFALTYPPTIYLLTSSPGSPQWLPISSAICGFIVALITFVFAGRIAKTIESED